MLSNYRELNSCLCCNGTNLEPLLDLSTQPLANSYHSNKDKLEEFPLAVNLCTTCFHVQQKVAVNPDLMFKNYAYVSGTSTTLCEYFDWFAKEITQKYFNTDDSKKVLDIACNDGTQLHSFKKLGWDVYGVDPAENLTGRAKTTGAQVECAYWDDTTAHKFNTTFDCLVAQNVFAHTANPLGFLETCKVIMNEDTRLFIQTSQANMFAQGEFDTIYHEHISFFSALSMQTLAHRAGFKIVDIFLTPIHGTSYVFVLALEGDETATDARIALEKNELRYTKEKYTQFAKKALQCVQNLKITLDTYRDTHTIIGYGAAAKGNTMLNFGQIKLDYIVDDNPLKQGLYTPGMNIPIYAKERLIAEKKPIIILPLAWNFFAEIRKKTKAIHPSVNDLFITYFPEIQVHS